MTKRTTKKAPKAPQSTPAPVKTEQKAAKTPAVASNEKNIADLTARIERLEKKINSNERFARTFVRSVNAQTAASEAITCIVRKSFCEDAAMRKELHYAMDQYDKRRRRKLISNIGSVIFWVLSVAVAAFVGAFIHWVFSGQN